MQHSNLPPVIRTFVVDGNEINIRYRGTWDEMCRNYVKSLPQNNAISKVVNHAITEDTGRRPSAVGAGQPGGVGAGVRGSEAGQ